VTRAVVERGRPQPTPSVERPSARSLDRIIRTARAGSRRVTLVHPGWITFAASVLLALLGIYCINLTAEPGAVSMSGLAKKQLAFLGVGLIAAFLTMLPSYRLIGRMTPLLVLATIGALVLLLAPFAPESLVTPRNGARRWINLGVVDFQPSELAKIVYVIAVARYLRFRSNHRRFLGLVPPALITFVPVALILVEPDLGTALLFLPALFAMLIAAGARLKHLILVVAVAAITAPAMYPLLQPHQKSRVQAIYYQIIGDDSHADSINYQGFRAMTVVGAGGATGLPQPKSRALLHFNRLPEDHNDMIFAVISTRFGLLGGLSLLALYLLWGVGALLSAAVSKDAFGRLVIVGLTAIVMTQMVINIGMTIGLLPITGMTLPFVSYGGSSLVAAFLAVGLICNVAMRRPVSVQASPFEFRDDDD